MKRYIVYNDVGEILRSGICHEDLVEAQAGSGEYSMECSPDVRDDTHKVVNGEVVPK